MKKGCKEMHKILAEMCNEIYPPGKKPYLGYSYSCPICNTVWDSDMKYIHRMDAYKYNTKKTVEAIFSNKMGIEMQQEVLKKLLKHLPK